METQYYHPEIFSISGVLSPQECLDYIYFSEYRGYEEAAVSLPSGPKRITGIRNNDRLLYADEKLTEKIWSRVKGFFPPELDGWKLQGLNEQWRFYRYEKGQRFNRHIDGRFRRSDGEESRITFMIYLNDNFEGGETAFDEFEVVPETGSALCFIHEHKHKGVAVTDGIKYVLRSDVMYRRD
jgi:hypothetical protein